MNMRTVRTIAIKEVTETLRDKRTLMAMIGVPLLLYPLMLLVGTQALMLRQGKLEKQTSRVIFTQNDGTTAPEFVTAWFEGDERFESIALPVLDSVDQEIADADETLVVEAQVEAQAQVQGQTQAQVEAEIQKADTLHKHSAEDFEAQSEASLKDAKDESNTLPSLHLSEAMIQRVIDGELDVVVLTPVRLAKQLEAGLSVPVQIAFDSTRPRSALAGKRVREVLEKQADVLLEARLIEAGLDASYIAPLALDSENIAPPKKRSGSVLGAVLPIMMIVMLGVGAFYPAVDLTAGEKERGTFETLLSTPTSKFEIVCGKFVTVLGLSLLTGLLNLGSMAATIGFQLAQLKPEEAVGGGSGGGGGGGAGAGAGGGGGGGLAALQVSVSDVAVMGVVLVPLALLIASVMMGVALLAKDFKEASNYLSPFFIAIVMPAMYAALPGTELEGALVFVPITNVALLFKGLLMQTATATQGFAVFMSTAAYAGMALQVAVWMFTREDVILSENKGLPLTLNRKAFSPRSLPTVGVSMLVLCVCLLLFFYVGTYVQARDVISGLIITQWLVLALPVLLILWWVKVDLKHTLRLNLPRPGAIAGVLLMAPASLILVTQFSFWLARYVSSSNLDQSLQPVMDSTSVWVLLFAIAVSPAVCEEILFRGAVLSGLKTKLKPWIAIVITGILFGLFHISPDRVPTTAALGIVIGFVCWRSGSIYPAMLYHLINNGLLVLLTKDALPAVVMDYVAEADLEQNGMPVELLIGSVVVFVLGLVVMQTLGGRREDR